MGLLRLYGEAFDGLEDGLLKPTQAVLRLFSLVSVVIWDEPLSAHMIAFTKSHHASFRAASC